VNRLATVLASVIATGTLFLFALFIWGDWNNPAWSTVVFAHFPATIGLPLAAAASFVVVAIFRTVEGPMKFEAFNIKFEGASGPIIMWFLCFVAIAGAIKALW
jgi:hypothetical protein